MNIIKEVYIKLLSGIDIGERGVKIDVGLVGDCYIKFPDFPDFERAVGECHYSNSELAYKIEWKNGRVVKFLRWDENGRKSSKKLFNSNGVTEKTIYYDGHSIEEIDE